MKNTQIINGRRVASDNITQKLIQKWIEGEKDHMVWEAQYLNYIKKLGYENFLTAMM